MKYSVLLYFIGSLISSPIHAQSLLKSQDVQFKQLRIEDGLSQSTINCIIQDKKGFLWFGTANGLNRYDGYSFNVFVNDPTDSTTLSDNGILSLYEDKNGNIWIGTVEGVLNKYERKKGTFTRYHIADELQTESAPDEKFFDFPLPFSRNNYRSITAITEDVQGNIWFGTWGKGLVKFNPTKNGYRHFHYQKNERNGFQSNRIKALVADSENVIWIATLGGGLYKLKFEKENYQLVSYLKNKNPMSLSDNRLVSLAKDKTGNLWIGTYGKGLNKLSKENQNFSPADAKFEKYLYQPNTSENILNDIIMSIIQDKNDKLWIGTLGGGLFQFNPATKKFFNFKNDPLNPNSINKNDILSVYEDRSGSIWVGTHLGKGLSKLQKNTIKFNQINRDTKGINGLNDDVVWSIIEDNDSNIWIGTYKGGLNKYDRKKEKFTYYKSSAVNGLSDNHIRSILDDGKGNLWLGTYNGGINIFNKAIGKAIHFLNDPNDSTSIGANQIQAIFMDNEKNFWIGTFGGGLNKLSSEDFQSNKIKFKRYKNNSKDPFSISDNRVYCVFQDRDGDLWIGTFGGGLNKFDVRSERFISYKKIPGDESSLSDNRVMTIFEDSMNNIWVGTYGGGVQKFNKRTEKFSSFSRRNRISSSVVYGILEDNNKNLWMSSDNGLIKFNLQTENFTQYDLHDGLQSLEFSGGAYFKSNSGEMFFGGINGFNYFYPENIIDNNYIPPIVISSIRIFNEPARQASDSLELSYNQNFFSFEFAALDYTNPVDNQYAYKLDGFDDDWHYVDWQRRIANYTNLLPGEYIFIVKGSNNDGVWNNDGARIYLRILPPFWRTWWFLSSVVIAAAFLIYYFSTMRYRNLLAIEKLKGKLAADLHDNVGSGLTEISILSELASHQFKNKSKVTSKHLINISDKARHLIDTMSDIVWMVNPQRDSFYHLILRLKDTYSDLLNAAGISFATSNLEKLNHVKISMEYKQNLYLIFKEGINNSIKHSKCKKIVLDVNTNKDWLELFLIDDGIGIDINKIKSGNGLNNMKKRAEAIGGKLIIDSSKDGTKIKFVCKISGIKKILSSYFG